MVTILPNPFKEPKQKKEQSSFIKFFFYIPFYEDGNFCVRQKKKKV